MASKTQQSVKLDGMLDEPIWQQVSSATDFITKMPVYGRPSTAQVVVKVIYDHEAIYVGAHIKDDINQIRKQFTARDQLSRSDVDYFGVFFDTYNDRQNGYQFIVTARNVQNDARLSSQAKVDYGTFGDVSWDAVWDSKVAFVSDGWNVEMKIPYFALRFSKQSIQEWGLQFIHFSRRKNETSFWNPNDPNINGFVNQFGNLSGLKDLRPPLRLSFSPYVSGGFRDHPHTNGKHNHDALRSGGMDLKYGLNESFTLDATLIPDFGQVVSDNIINNISPYEVQFTENRPFFTEGTELFNKSGIFYSRRVGGTPQGYNAINDAVNGGILSNYSIRKNPSITPLYNALKFSGRTEHDLGIGIFNAVAQPTFARLRQNYNGKDTALLTEPLTNYSVVVFDQALKNRSSVTFTNTNVLREGAQRDANVSALDLALYDANNTYGLKLSGIYSNVIDPQKSYDGYSVNAEVGKVSGGFQYAWTGQIESLSYDPNDLGFLYAPNELNTGLALSYQIFEPKGSLLNQRYSVKVLQSYLYKPVVYQSTTVNASAFWMNRSFWDLTLLMEAQPFWYNDFFELQTPSDLRATPRMKLRKARNFYFGIAGSSDSRKPFFFRYDIGFAESPLPKDPFYLTQIGMRYRFSDRFSIDMDHERREDRSQFGYAFLRDPNTQAPILSRRLYKDATTLLTGTYSFTSRVNMNFRLRHFWNRIKNYNFYNVLPDGNWRMRNDYVPATYDYNYNAFNVDLFLTWDFRLGSRVVLGWKNWMGRDFAYTVDPNDHLTYLNNLTQVFSTPHGNEWTMRFIYFLNYQQLQRK